ncbi:MAG: N-acetylmuramoyl-L-alanine amidase [Pseudomonadota bacterium]
MLFALAATSVDASAQEASELRSVRFGAATANKTRIVFDVKGAPEYRISGDGAGAGTLYVEFSNLASVHPSARRVKGRGLVKTAQYAPNEGAVARVSMPLKRTVKIDEAFVIPPSRQNPLHRLVIDVSAADKVAFLASLGIAAPSAPPPAPPAKTSSVSAPTQEVDAPSAKSEKQLAESGAPATPSAKPRNDSLAAQRQSQPERGADAPTVVAQTTRAQSPDARSARDKTSHNDKKVVVIDPGHGGTDPGAIGAGGTKEKSVTLAAAKALKARLEAAGGYKVVMTRSGDQRLALQERAPIARSAGADLFISIHADALKDRSVRGASVYTLSEEGTQRSAVVAEEEGDLVVFDVDLRRTDPDVRGILFDLAHEHTGSRSDQLAELIVAKLGGVTPLLNNTHRRGDLRVLLAPDVPAVLLELGFLSNADDEKNFVSDAWRSRTMKAVADAIEAYFDALPSDRHANASESTSR